MTMTATKKAGILPDTNHALTNAEGQLEEIIRLYRELYDRDGYESTTQEDEIERVEEAARDMALDVCYRSQEWITVGDKGDFEPTQGRVLLSTGGPACQVICDLEQGCPVNPEIQWQDWGTPWTFAHIKHDLGLDFDEGDKALNWFINLFYFGE